MCRHPPTHPNLTKFKDLRAIRPGMGAPWIVHRSGPIALPYLKKNFKFSESAQNSVRGRGVAQGLLPQLSQEKRIFIFFGPGWVVDLFVGLGSGGCQGSAFVLAVIVFHSYCPSLIPISLKNFSPQTALSHLRYFQNLNSFFRNQCATHDDFFENG